MPAITSDYVAAQNGTGGGGIGIGNNYAADATRHHLLRLPTDKPASLPTAANTIASIIVSHFLPAAQPPSSENLVVANSGEDLTNFHDATLDFFDEDDDLFGSPLAFDASNEGLWNGLFVPPPPRPPFFEDEAVLSDGLTTCDLCSWAMPTKSTFILEGTIEKASELGWPLTLIIVSILSALLGAIIMITVVRCRRKKTSNNRNETHVQWWSRNKRPSSNNNNNNHLRRSNIYTAHPADSIRGLPQPTLSASSSLTAVSAMGAAAAAMQAPAAVPAHHQQETQQQQLPQSQYYHQQQQQQHAQQQFQPHLALMVQQQQQQQHQKQQQQQHEYEYEHEYHQPQELQMRQRSSSVSSASATPLPSLKTTIATMMPLPVQLQRHHHHFHQQQQEQKREASSNIWQNGQSTLAVAS